MVARRILRAAVAMRVAGVAASDEAELRRLMAARNVAMSAARMGEVAARRSSGDGAAREAGDATPQRVHVVLAARAQLFRRGEAAAAACAEEQVLACRGERLAAVKQLGHRDVARFRRRRWRFGELARFANVDDAQALRFRVFQRIETQLERLVDAAPAMAVVSSARTTRELA